jgi:hypothetical protein
MRVPGAVERRIELGAGPFVWPGVGIRLIVTSLLTVGLDLSLGVNAGASCLCAGLKHVGPR